MAENDDKNAPNADDKSAGGGDNSNKDEWKTITGGKFTSGAELAKAYKDLEKKSGEVGEEVRQAREFATVINPILEEIRNDPEIFKKLDDRLKNKGKNSDNSDKKPVDNKDDKPVVDTEARNFASDTIIQRFEEKYGIDKMEEDDAKKLRDNIGKVILRTTGTNLGKIDLRRLPGVLDDAYIIANKDKLIEKSKLEALASARGNDDGAISGVPSSSSKGSSTLNSEEADVAGKLGLTRDQYISGRKQR